jgi:1,4-alpha-glucan branching enzyme
MGGEIGQRAEWDPNGEVTWGLLDQGPYHRGLQRFLCDINHLYRGHPALWQGDYEPDGFFWVDCSDQEASVLSFVRQTALGRQTLLVILNLTPVVRARYRVGTPQGGFWREIINSDSEVYGGSNQGNWGGVTAEAIAQHNQLFSAEFTLPPLSIIAFRHEAKEA